MNCDPETAKRFLISAALDEIEMVCDYVDSGGLPADATYNGKPTALAYAALNANPYLVEFLIARGADPNHRDALEMTPLHYAALGACAACTRLLIAAGADRTLRNRFGKPPSALLPAHMETSLKSALLRLYQGSPPVAAVM